jgi:hypothetical protein
MLNLTRLRRDKEAKKWDCRGISEYETVPHGISWQSLPAYEVLSSRNSLWAGFQLLVITL